MDNIKSVGQIIQDIETNYTSQKTKISEHVDFSQFDNINRIEAYLASKHVSGDTDAMGREKPFANIVTSAVNIWYRATKRRLNEIKVRADKEGNVLSSYMATILLRNWARKSKFEPFLTQWGMTLAAYGSAVTKWIDRGDELDFSVMKWGNLMSDPMDFYANPVAEKFYLTPADLMNHKGYDKGVAKALLDSLTSRQNLRHEQKDNKPDFIELYELHGVFPLELVTGKESDRYEYVQQMHIVSKLGSKTNNDYEEFVLASGREDKSPYILTNLLPDPTGQRATGIGAVELLFDSQWMVNHNSKLIKDQLDLASKLIFQTSDGSFVGKNATTNIENGDIMITEINQPLTQVANNSHDIASLQAAKQDWNTLSQSLSSTPEAMRGGDIKSGTAYRTQQLAVNESSSLFEEMGYSKDIAIKEMFREFIIPFIKRKMDTTEEIAAIMDHQDIKKIDSKFVSNRVAAKVNAKMIADVLNGDMPTPEDQDRMMQEEEVGMQAQLADLGNQRFFKPSDIDGKTWKESIKDFEWDIEIDTPTDQKDVNLAMETLTNVLATVADPVKAQALQTPMGKFLFNKILTLTGAISPLELGDIEASQDMKLQQQTMQSEQQLDPTGQQGLPAQQAPQMAT